MRGPLRMRACERLRSRAAAWAAGAILGLAAPPARADGDLTVHVDGCPRLDEGEVTRLLAIELGDAVLHGGRELRVQITCDGGARVRIVAIDSITAKQLEREIELDPGAVDRQRERVVAILASQLFLSSWSELLLPRSTDVEAAVPVLRTTPEAAHLAESRARSAFTVAPAARWDVVASGGVRARSLGDPWIDGRLAIRAGVVLGPATLFVDLGAERGDRSRSDGTISASLLEGALGAAARVVRRRWFALDLDGAVGPTWIDVRGVARAPGVLAGSASGVVGEASLALAPKVLLGRVHLGIVLEGGAVFSRARAHAGEAGDVSLAGPWLGASLAIGFAEVER